MIKSILNALLILGFSASASAAVSLKCQSQDKDGVVTNILEATVDSKDALHVVKFLDLASASAGQSPYVFEVLYPTQAPDRSVGAGNNFYQLGDHWTNGLILPKNVIKAAQNSGGKIKAEFTENYYGAMMSDQAICSVK
ncbi:MAG: hypothetical protein ACOYOK_12635 [Pseudobdellovibrionaceae bacterium]